MVRYAVAAVLVRLADEGARVVLVLAALERTGSAALGGLLVAALLVPQVAAAPALGLLVDRSRRPTVLLAGAAAIFALGLAVPALALGRAPTAVAVAALLAAGCCGPALTGGLSSRLPGLVAPGALPRAFGVDALTYDVAGMIGPAAGAVVAGRAGPTAGVTVLVVAAAIGAVVIATLRHGLDAAPGDPAAPIEGLLAGLLAGVRAILRSRPLAVVTASTTAAQVGAGALPVVVAVAAQRGRSPADAGVLLAALTFGALAGSLAWTWRPAPARHAALVVALGLAASGLPLAVAAAVPGLWARAALFALSGLANGPVFGALLVSRQRYAPPGARSQVFTLGAGAKITAAAAGAAGAGLVAGVPTWLLLLLTAAWPLAAGAGAGLALAVRR